MMLYRMLKRLTIELIWATGGALLLIACALTLQGITSVAILFVFSVRARREIDRWISRRRQFIELRQPAGEELSFAIR